MARRTDRQHNALLRARMRRRTEAALRPEPAADPEWTPETVERPLHVPYTWWQEVLVELAALAVFYSIFGRWGLLWAIALHWGIAGGNHRLVTKRYRWK